MADNILTTGSCLKSELYNRIKTILTGAGWTNVSSLASTDYDIFHSGGVATTKELYIQMRATNSADLNSVETTDYSAISMRLLDSYTPGAPGVAGTIPRSANPWLDITLVSEATNSSAVTQASTMEYLVYADLNKLIMVIRPPIASTLPPIVLYMGLPDTLYSPESLSRGVVLGHNYSANSTYLWVSNTPDGMATITAPELLPTIAQIAPKNPNSDGVYCVSEIFYGNSDEGIRAKLDGVLALPNQAVVDGDTLTIGTSTYQIVVNALGAGSTSFPSAAIAVRIS